MKTWIQLMACAALSLPAIAVHADKKTDTVETASGKHTTKLADAGDRKFVEKAASGGMAEVKLGQLAVDKGTSPTVKEFGKRMVDDHGKANDELKAIASKKNFPLPTDVDTEAKATYDKLAKLSGSDFDKAYIDAMVKDHDADVKEFKKEASTGGVDPDLKAWAQKTLNVIQEHDHMAHQDKDAIKK
jgi:putative membrane protein